eukprot:SAG31_NODE_45593_length_258_cov_0.654088_1_plen_40_part_10
MAAGFEARDVSERRRSRSVTVADYDSSTRSMLARIARKTG